MKADFATIMIIIINAILIENFVLVKFLGICPFLGVSKKTETALGMGMAVTFTITVSSALTWAVNEFILLPLELEYLRTVAFILVIAALVQFIETALQKLMPPLYQSLGIYLPLITTNCAVLGSALLNIQNGYGFFESVIFGFSASIGFTLAIVLFSGVRERLKYNEIPKSFQGFPMALLAAAIMSMTFMGFQGLKLPF